MWQSGNGTLRGSAKHRLSLLACVSLTLGLSAGAQTPPPAPQQTGEAAREAGGRAQVQPLEYGGAPAARELADGDIHVYQLRLAAGQFAYVLIDQRGIDVAVKVYGPDGRQVAEVDGPNGMQGPEPVYLVAEAGGDYRVELRPLEKGAGRGSYEIRLKELRAATAQDASRVAAQKVYAEGEAARSTGTREGRQETIRKFEEARRLYLAAGDRTAAAAMLHNIGYMYASLGDTQRALEYYNEALPQRQAAGDRKGEGYTLHGLGAIYDAMGEKQKALEYYGRALPIWRAIGDRSVEIYTLTSMGVAYSSLGQKQKALEYYNQAMPLHKAVGDRGGEAYTLTNIGAVYDSLGERQKALDYYGQALSLWKAVGDRTGESATLTNIGGVYHALGEWQKALDYHGRALALRKEAGDRRGEAHTLADIGVVYDSLGEEPKALDYYGRALALYEAVGDRKGEAYVLHSAGAVYEALGEKQKAAEQYGRALALRRAVHDRTGEATTLRNLARLERDRGNLAAAREFIGDALPLVESVRSNVASQELRASFFATVRNYYELSIDILMRSHTADPSAGYAAEALQTSERARARSLLDLLAEARIDIRQGVDPRLAERELAVRQRLDAKLEYQFRLLSARHRPEQAAAAAAEIAALTTEFEQVQGEIRAASPAYAALTQPRPLTWREIQQQVLDPDTLLLEYSLGEERSYLWLVSDTSLHSFTLPNRAEIETAAVALMRVLSEGGTPEEFERRAAEVSRLLLDPVAEYLGDKRLVIVADGALHYVPFAALPPPPRPGRVGPSRPLIAEHEIVSLPSASTLASLRRQVAGRRPAAKSLAVFADPVFTRDDERIRSTRAAVRARRAPPHAAAEAQQEYARASAAARSLGIKRAGFDLRRLPFSRREAARLLALVPRRETLAALDFKASQATAMSPEVQNYRIVHFATHGYLNPERPELSGLVLSLVNERGESQDGFLSLPEVYNLHLPAELVVLSACQTGLGKQIQGEGLVGLTRGFMYAGAPRVVASLWEVEDRATSEMMGRFYEAMLRRGLRPAAALRAAQLSMQSGERWSAPHLWAGFVLQGEWR